MEFCIGLFPLAGGKNSIFIKKFLCLGGLLDALKLKIIATQQNLSLSTYEIEKKISVSAFLNASNEMQQNEKKIVFISTS